MTEYIVETIISIGIAAITYFLKRTMNQVDGQRRLLEQMETRAEAKETAADMKREIKEIRDNYTPIPVHNKAFDECRDDIKHIKSEYLTKDDFIREISKMDRKLDRLLEMVIEETKRRGI